MTTEQTITDDTADRIKGSVNSYLDRLAEGHERFIQALGTARERNARVTDKMFDTMIGGQREAIALTKTIAAQPTEIGKNMEAFMQSMTNTQERTLDLAKAVYKEQSEATSQARELIEPLIASGKNLGKPFEKMAGMFTPSSK